MNRSLALMLLLIAALSLAACGGDEDLGEGEPEGVDDETYLAVLCSSQQEFSNVLIGRGTPDEITAAIDMYVASLRDVVPPADVAKFHREYIAYLQSARDNPAELTQPPPLPPDKPRQRIAAKESSVDECKNPTFFSDGNASG